MARLALPLGTAAAVAALAPVLATGANVLKITPAPSLAGVAALPVKGRSPTAFDKRVRFGDWQVQTVSKFDQRGRAVGVSVESDRKRKAISLRGNVAEFELAVTRAGGTPTQVSCETRIAAGDHEKSAGRRSDETSLTLPGYPRIDCTFGGALTGVLATQAAAVTLFETGACGPGRHALADPLRRQGGAPGLRAAAGRKRGGYGRDRKHGTRVAAADAGGGAPAGSGCPGWRVALFHCSAGAAGSLKATSRASSLWSERSDRTSARPGSWPHGPSARRSCRSRCGTCRSGCSRSACPLRRPAS
jgi:hypothetical protein